MCRRSPVQKFAAFSASRAVYGHEQEITVGWLTGRLSEPFVNSPDADTANAIYEAICNRHGADPRIVWSDA
jgi:hypothetical protein